MKTHLVLLIGLTKEGAHWDDDFVENLKSKFQADKVTLIDLPGSGHRVAEKSPLSIEKIAANTREYYKPTIRDDERNILVSVSLGGMVGCAWLEQFPDDFEKFIIINASFKNLSPLTERVQPYAIKQFFNAFLSLSQKSRDRKIVEMCSNNKSRCELTLKKWDRLASERAMNSLNIIRQTFAGSQFSLGKKPKIKTFVVAAKGDRLASYKCSEKLVKEWDCDSFFFEGTNVGHAAHIDAPEELAEKIYQWVHNFNHIFY